MSEKKVKKFRKLNGPKPSKLIIVPIEGKLSHIRRAINKQRETVDVKVIDVRDGKIARAAGELMLKSDRASKGSKFFRPSFSLWGYSYNAGKK